MGDFPPIWSKFLLTSGKVNETRESPEEFDYENVRLAELRRYGLGLL